MEAVPRRDSTRLPSASCTLVCLSSTPTQLFVRNKIFNALIPQTVRNLGDGDKGTHGAVGELQVR